MTSPTVAEVRAVIARADRLAIQAGWSRAHHRREQFDQGRWWPGWLVAMRRDRELRDARLERDLMLSLLMRRGS